MQDEGSLDSSSLKAFQNKSLIQEFPNWGTCTLSGTFAYRKGYKPFRGVLNP